MKKKAKKRAPGRAVFHNIFGDVLKSAPLDLGDPEAVTGTLVGELTIKFGGQTLSFPATFRAGSQVTFGDASSRYVTAISSGGTKPRG